MMRRDGRANRLRRETINHPSVIGPARVTEAIVQSIRASLPEFVFVWFDLESAPMWRQRDLAFLVAFRHLLQTRVEDLSRVDYLALFRDPRAQTAADWSQMEIGGGIFARSSFD